jgi:hypothetical protein
MSQRLKKQIDYLRGGHGLQKNHTETHNESNREHREAALAKNPP